MALTKEQKIRMLELELELAEAEAAESEAESEDQAIKSESELRGFKGFLKATFPTIAAGGIKPADADLQKQNKENTSYDKNMFNKIYAQPDPIATGVAKTVFEGIDAPRRILGAAAGEIPIIKDLVGRPEGQSFLNAYADVKTGVFKRVKAIVQESDKPAAIKFVLDLGLSITEDPLTFLGGLMTITKGLGKEVEKVGGAIGSKLSKVSGAINDIPAEDLQKVIANKPKIIQSIKNQPEIGKELYKSVYKPEIPSSVNAAIQGKTAQEGIERTAATQQVSDLNRQLADRSNKVINEQDDLIKQQNLIVEQNEAQQAIRVSDKITSKQDLLNTGNSFKAMVTKPFGDETFSGNPIIKSMNDNINKNLESAGTIDLKSLIDDMVKLKENKIGSASFDRKITEYVKRARAVWKQKKPDGSYNYIVPAIDGNQIRKDLDGLIDYNDVNNLDAMEKAVFKLRNILKDKLIKASAPEYKSDMEAFSNALDVNDKVKGFIARSKSPDQALLNMTNPLGAGKGAQEKALQDWHELYGEATSTNYPEQIKDFWMKQKAPSKPKIPQPSNSNLEEAKTAAEYSKRNLIQAEDNLKSTIDPGTFSKEWENAIKQADPVKREELIQQLPEEYKPALTLFHEQQIQRDIFQKELLGVTNSQKAKFESEKLIEKLGSLNTKEKKVFLRAYDKKNGTNFESLAGDIKTAKNVFNINTKTINGKEVKDITIPLMGKRNFFGGIIGLDIIGKFIIKPAIGVVIGPATYINTTRLIKKAYEVGAIGGKYITDAGGIIGMKASLLSNSVRAFNNMSKEQQDSLDKAITDYDGSTKQRQEKTQKLFEKKLNLNK